MLLQHEPQQRLGSASLNGVAGVKEHDFFVAIDWERLLRQKAQFVPELSGEDDTSYFDSKFVQITFVKVLFQSSIM